MQESANKIGQGMRQFKTIIFIGPQGSGKGTQAHFLIPKIHAEYFEAGALLRQTAKQDTEMGAKIRNLIDNGILIKDDLWKVVAESKLESIDPNAPLIIDGSPRRIGQAHILLNYLKSSGRVPIITIYISLPRQESIRRLQNRRVCEDCQSPDINNDGTVVNDGSAGATQRCSYCGGKLVMRKDDVDINAINERLKLYESETLPALEYLKENTEFHEIDGRPSMSEIALQIDDILGLEPEIELEPGIGDRTE